MLKGLNNLIIAYLSGNDIYYSEDDAFESTPKLFGLILNNNNISTINQQMFAGLNRLYFLRLGGNLMRELTTDSFGNSSQLRVLDMRIGKLETVDFNAFAHLPRLGCVDLSYNQISRLVKFSPTTWNTNVKTNTTLETELTDLSDEIDLEWIMLILSKAGKFSSENIKFLSGPHLKKSMIDHILETFPSTNGSNYGLKELVLSGNKLTEIEKNIFAELKTMKKLFLSENPITKLYPESFAGLNELELFFMDYCKLTSIDISTLAQLTQLRALHFSTNQLTTITAVPLPSIEGLGNFSNPN